MSPGRILATTFHSSRRPGHSVRYTDTLQALAQPSRAIPTALVGAALVAAQLLFEPSIEAAVVAVAMVSMFILVGPAAWRSIFVPADGPRFGWRVLAFGLVGAAAVLLVGRGLPLAVGLAPTLLTANSSLAVELSLFWVGAWGLGRDIELEIGLAAAEHRASRLALEAERAQLLAIRSQLDPHFLFNTLNAIAEWCQADPAVAERAVLTLSDVLRDVLRGARVASWPLSDELGIARRLWELHETRDPERIQTDFDVTPSALDFPVPPLLLLPLAENAMTHGPWAGHSGPVRLHAEAVDDALTVTISNPGTLGARRPGGEGLAMVERRLALAYGEGGATLTMHTDAERVVATLRIGKRQGEVA